MKLAIQQELYVKYPLSPHLRRLESEAIFIMREVAAEFARPVMLYSIGKDLSAMLHLALKAFFPSKPPFPLLHVDTTWKFREMIAFRDQIAKRAGMELLVHINKEGLARGISPVATGSSVHTQVMKYRRAAPGPRSLAFRRGVWGCPARRGKKPGQGKDLFAPLRRPCLGTAQPTARTLAAVQH